MGSFNGEAFAILEVDTGFLDGWYSGMYEPDEMLAYWREARPAHSHEVIWTPKGKGFPIPDARFLANQD